MTTRIEQNAIIDIVFFLLWFMSATFILIYLSANSSIQYIWNGIAAPFNFSVLALFMLLWIELFHRIKMKLFHRRF